MVGKSSTNSCMASCSDYQHRAIEVQTLGTNLPVDDPNSDEPKHVTGQCAANTSSLGDASEGHNLPREDLCPLAPALLKQEEDTCPQPILAMIYMDMNQIRTRPSCFAGQ